MSGNIIFSRFAVVSEVSADDVFSYVLARDTQKEGQSVLVAQLQAPWRENCDVVEDLNEYFGRLQGVRGQGVMRVLVVTQNKKDGFGVAFEEPEGICLEEISDLDASMRAPEFVDNLCESIHKANVKGVFHCHLRKQDVWVSGNTVGITGFGYSVVAKHGWKGNSIEFPPELVSGGEADSRSDVYSIAQLLVGQYPDHRDDSVLRQALDQSPGQRPKKARELLSDLLLSTWNDSDDEGADSVEPDGTSQQTGGVRPKGSGVRPKPGGVRPAPDVDARSASGQQRDTNASSQSHATEPGRKEDGDMPAKGEERLRELVRNMVYDNYCDQRTEHELIREAIDKLSLDQTDASLIISMELESMGAANERRLLEMLEGNLRQKSSSRGKKLLPKDKDDILDIVCKPRAGYRKGLNRQIADQCFVEYCRAHGVKLKSGLFGWKVP